MIDDAQLLLRVVVSCIGFHPQFQRPTFYLIHFGHIPLKSYRLIWMKWMNIRIKPSNVPLKIIYCRWDKCSSLCAILFWFFIQITTQKAHISVFQWGLDIFVKTCGSLLCQSNIFSCQFILGIRSVLLFPKFLLFLKKNHTHGVIRRSRLVARISS